MKDMVTAAAQMNDRVGLQAGTVGDNTDSAAGRIATQDSVAAPGKDNFVLFLDANAVETDSRA